MEEPNFASFSAGFLTATEETVRKIRADYSQKMDQAIELLFEAWKEGRWVYVMGNGGSASSATHLAADLSKTICASPQDKGLKSMALFENVPLISASINDWGWDDLFVNQLKTFYVSGGVGIGLSVHGGSGQDLSGQWSQNLLKGLQYIKDKGGKTIGFSGFDGGPMKDLVDIGLVVPFNSTPMVESLHAVLFHAIVFGLKDRINEYKKTSYLY